MRQPPSSSASSLSFIEKEQPCPIQAPHFKTGSGDAYEEAPSLLYLYATKPIASILSPAAQEKHGLRLEGVPVRIEPQLLTTATTDWRKTFFRLKEKAGRYIEDDRAIKVYGNRLFIADIPLPSDLQVGTYRIETLLVQSGKVIGHNSGQFEVCQVGIERWIWNVAHDHPWLFGAIFTLAVMIMGLCLSALFHRSRQSMRSGADRAS